MKMLKFSFIRLVAVKLLRSPIIWSDVDPWISRENVVWTTWIDRNPEIYLMQIRNSVHIRVSNNAGMNALPHINGDYIAWFGDSEDGDSDIYVYQISTGIIRQVSSNEINDVFAEVSGDYVVWQGYADGDSEIYLYEISTGTISQISNNDTEDTNPKID